MEADLELLPRRQHGFKSVFKNADAMQFYSNFFQINLEDKKSFLYQYVLESQIPADSTQMLQKAVRSVKRELKQKIGLLTYRANMLWGAKSSKIAHSLICVFTHEEKEYKIEVLIKQTKEMRMMDMLSNLEDADKIKQILNISTKEILRSMKMNQLGVGKFYLSDNFMKNQVAEAGLSVWRGYKFSICPIKQNLYLQIDVCSRVLRTNNFLETMNGSSKDYIRNTFIGNIVIARYGKHRTYKIQDIDFNLTPLSQFYNQKQAGKITYQKYYKDFYMLNVVNKKQPLIKAISHVKKQIKNGKIQQIPQYVNLIPQFVSLTGMSDQMRANHQIMKDLAQHTKLTPQQRCKETDLIVDKYNKEQGLYKIGGQTLMKGFILDQPQFTLQKNVTKATKDGNLFLKEKVKDPAKFNDWLFVYSVGQKPDYDDNDADYAVETLKKAQQVFGILTESPGFITIKGRKADDWKQNILSDVKKNGKPQIIVLFFNQYQEKLYGELKRFITNQINIPCQVIRRRTLANKNKTALSCASKIILQMNAKIGKPLWQMKMRHPYFKQKKVMYGALSLSKGKGGFTLAFVGTTNPSSTQIYSNCKLGIKRKQQIPPAILEEIFVNWAKNFYMANKCAPDAIIMYRQGLSQQQIKKQLTNQIESLQKMVHKIGTKIKNPNYNPEIMYITINKKINSRFFAPLEKRHNQGKFVPKLGNPVSGSVVLQEMSVNNAYDFHLVPQFVNQGTCTPTLYRVAYNDSQIPQQAIVEFTFEQCFNYYNWQGAVRVPACLQCADKLSKLVGEHIKEDIVPSDLQKYHYFL